MPKIGLALSGGGFRATAFHLGVLKRLNEVGLLDRLDVLSTVSGGSIAGAFWVYWKSPSNKQPSSWEGFEDRLIAIMRANVRGRLLFVTFLLPALATAIAVYVSLGATGAGPWLRAAASLIAAVTIGYLGWLGWSGHLLTRLYDRYLFHGAHLTELKPPQGTAGHRIPRLLVNATAIETGRLVLFGHEAPVVELALDYAESLKNKVVKGLAAFVRGVVDHRVPGDLPPVVRRTASFARAVAASSAVPGIFPPVAVGSALQSFGEAWRRNPKSTAEQRAWLDTSAVGGATYLAVDGGVFDNQGLQALVDSGCDVAIVSDASAPFMPRRSAWLRWPIPLLKRSQDIIYERVRNLNYAVTGPGKQFEALIREGERTEKLTNEAAAWLRQKLRRPPGIQLQDAPTPGLPSDTAALLRAIRTDLDRFSATEISALMFHGYACAEPAVRALRDQLELANAPFEFKASRLEVDLRWNAISKEDQRRIDLHLAASTMRWGIGRGLVRGVQAVLSLWPLRPREERSREARRGSDR